MEGEGTRVHFPSEAYRGTIRESKFVNTDGSLVHARPCVRLRKALYGHPDAGSCWERHCDARVASCGFQKVPEWPSCYFNSELKLFLIIYVDDFKLSGLEGNIPEGWKLLRKAGLKLEKERPPGFFLGCIHGRLDTVINGIAARGFAYNCEAYLLDTCKRYCDLVFE